MLDVWQLCHPVARVVCDEMDEASDVERRGRRTVWAGLGCGEAAVRCEGVRL